MVYSAVQKGAIGHRRDGETIHRRVFGHRKIIVMSEATANIKDATFASSAREVRSVQDAAEES